MTDIIAVYAATGALVVGRHYSLSGVACTYIETPKGPRFQSVIECADHRCHWYCRVEGDFILPFSHKVKGDDEPCWLPDLPDPETCPRHPSTVLGTCEVCREVTAEQLEEKYGAALAPAFTPFDFSAELDADAAETGKEEMEL